MGLLDRASRGLNRAGDETVRVVDYDSVPQEEVEKQEKAPKVPKEPKTPKERRKLNLGAAARNLLPERHTEPREEKEDEDFTIEETPAPPAKKFVSSETAFEIDEDEPSFYEEKQKLWDRETSTNVDDLLPKDGAIQDVLDVLNVPATFTIREDILMPDDFSSVEFDVQVPQGYDIGQVEYFKERAEASVKEYLKLLEARNGHIAKLATAVDRLQVDANNLKYDNQIAAGIGIIPTSESVDLENEVMELKLQVQKFKDAQKTTINSDERKLYEEMRDELSRVIRENEDLKETNYELKSLVAQLEENSEEMVTMPSSYTEHESAEIIFETMDGELPNFSNETFDTDDEALPDFSIPETPPTMKPRTSSFEVDDEDSLDDFMQSLQATPEEPEEASLLSDDDNEDDDELDKLMRDWKA